MDNLPFELYELIFKFLNFRDLFNLSLTSEYHKNLIKNLKFKRLVFQHSNISFGQIYEPIESNLIDYNLSILKSDQFNFKNDLKYLKICTLTNKRDLEFINELNQLIHLEIYFKLNFESIEINNTLSLPNLKTLHLCCRESRNFEIFNSINCRKLEKFTFNCSKLLKGNINIPIYNLTRILHPESIKHIKIYHLFNLNLFVNLEVLEYDIDTFDSNLEEEIRDLVKLKKILIKSVIYVKHELELIEDYIDLFKRFLNNLSSFQNRNLQIYLYGIKVLDNSINFIDLKTSKFQELVYSEDTFKDLLTIQMSNYNLLDYDLYWVFKINYNYLMSLVDELPVDFFKKFNNIQVIQVDGEVEENKLLKFIKNCKNCKRFEISNSSFTDSPAYNNELTHLELRENI